MMGPRQIEKHLKGMLGGEYGGPSLGFSNSQFIIYSWADAPVSVDIHATGATLEDVIFNMLAYKARQVLKRKPKTK